MVDRSPATMATSPTLAGGEKKHWWLSTKKIVDRYVKDARVMIASREPSEIAAALSLLDAALALSPRFESALELKARCLLYLRRFKDVADMLLDYIPSYKMGSEDSSCSSDNSSQQLSRERVKLLPSENSSSGSTGFKCFSVSDLKRKVMAGLCKNCENEGQWRYSVLGQACCHLGLMEDAMVLLQTGKRLATAASRHESICLSEDSFSSSHIPLPVFSADTLNHHQQLPPVNESETIAQLLSQIKLLLRRRTAALSALDAGLYSEAIRHFSKILDGRRPAPQSFLAECYMHRSIAYRSAGRIAESIADCNRALALDPSFIQALQARASLFELIGCITDAVHDLEHVKLLFNSILRDRKLPGPAWKPQRFRYREIPGKLCSLTAKIQELKQKIVKAENGKVDHYALFGLRRGCSRSELERAHLVLVLRHKPDRAICFIDRCEFADGRDHDSARDRAKMSALLLYRLIQKGYSSVMAAVVEEEAAEKVRRKGHSARALEGTAATITEGHQHKPDQEPKPETVAGLVSDSVDSDHDQARENKPGVSSVGSRGAVFQGVFCRDLVVVGNLLSQVGFNRPLSLKYEALSC
ncbi:hypothetical protein Nepgr_004163 [Nepenthes gracilis]|uniref:Uncharacterized protein n=1 Tax=Nepenthes gracilis TaxID=150966 RepID=A0AAD3XEQ6_NEPGR|nr:hypothetical protein Nepgr_004163 [Nepenthes gracilis]